MKHENTRSRLSILANSPFALETRRFSEPSWARRSFASFSQLLPTHAMRGPRHVAARGEEYFPEILLPKESLVTIAERVEM